MAIKNPNPNIKDFEINDNTTWSSNHIAAGLQAAGVEVGSEGSVDQKKATLIADVTVTEESQTFLIPGATNLTSVIAVINCTFSDTTTNGFAIKATTESVSTPFHTGAYSTRSYTGGTEFKSTLYASCEHGLMTGYAVVSSVNGNASSNIGNFTEYTDNILTEKFKTIMITSSNNIPVGTKIKLYGY